MDAPRLTVNGSPIDGNRICLRLPSSIEWIGVVRAAVQAFAQSLGDGWLERLELPVVEAATNAIRHAHGGDASIPFELSIGRCDDRVVVEVADRGPCFDPPAATGEVPDLMSDHGRGLFLMRAMTDRYTVDHPDGHNRVVLEWRME
jgi:serine/threonine-protein kinase RsbW